MKCFLKYWLPLLIWGSVIFVGSTNLMSARHTSRFVVPFLLWLKPGISPQTIWGILVAVRKFAHVIEYAVLALLLCLAMSPGTGRMLQGAPQETVASNASERVSRSPVITAKPQRVVVSDAGGSTEIEWDTGTESPGFVFVTEDGRKPVLFASDPRGSRIAPWIGKHPYVFELYGDDQRRTLLARVTVSGSPDTLSSQQPTISWKGTARWMLIVGLVAISYFALYLTSTSSLRTTFPTEPTTSPRPLHVVRNLLLSIATFILLDGVIFHSGLYVSILAPGSYAGRIAEITQAEKDRASSGLKEILVLGDS